MKQKQKKKRNHTIIFCKLKLHSATEHILLCKRFTWLNTFRDDVHSFLGVYLEEKTMHFSLILSQTVDPWSPLPSYSLFLNQWDLRGFQMTKRTGHWKASFMWAKPFWNPRQPAGLCWIRQSFTCTIFYVCLHHKLALQFEINAYRLFLCQK